MSKSASAAKENVDSPARKAQKKEILDAALAVVGQGNGLTVSLEHLNFEAIVKDSGVPRSSAYRLWPNGREGFLRDLLIELSGPSWSGTAAFDHETVRVARDVVANRLDELKTLQGRKAVLEEAVRVGAKQNYEALLQDARWRTYIALNATALSMPDEALQDELRERMRISEEQFLAYMTSFYEEVAIILGLKLREGFGYDDLAIAAASIIEGLALRRMLSPRIVDREHRREGSDEPWSLAAVGFLAMLYEMTDFVDDYDPEVALRQYFQMMASS